MNKTLKGTIEDLAGRFLYYDRKEDDALPVGEIERMVKDGEVTVDEICGQLYHGQKVLLCSDGLTCEITDHQIGAIISAEGSNQEIVETLIHAANTRGGEDNITAILISSPEDSPIKPRNGNGRRLYTTTLNRMLEGKKELKSGSAIVIGVLALVAACLLTYFLV